MKIRVKNERGEVALEAGMKKFLEPQSVAVIGASATPGKGGNDIIKNIQSNDYRGGLYLVNPRGGEILGVKVFKSVSDLPAGIDLAVLVLPASASIQALRECAKRGMKAAVLVAGGFAEVDEQGEELQKEILSVVRETGMRVLGPNTSGLLSMPQHLAASFFPLGKIPRGHVSYIAQTGNSATPCDTSCRGKLWGGLCGQVGTVDVERGFSNPWRGSETKAIFSPELKRPRRFLRSLEK
jgi:acetyltransferase